MSSDVAGAGMRALPSRDVTGQALRVDGAPCLPASLWMNGPSPVVRAFRLHAIHCMGSRRR